ncbi:hypothetical protein BSKO_09392 [Bryopsis sp. KO-2023]|nr:hypothetical protein BSKO_09392 [Bryopsis sp. KO-2023]
MERSRVALDCELNFEGVPEHVAWCSSSNLVAVACRSTSSRAQVVCILEPDCPQEHVAVKVPLADETDGVISLVWSPLGSPCGLLTATRNGVCYVWRQSNGAEALATNKWYGSKIADLGKRIVCGKWLSAAPCWGWVGGSHQSNHIPPSSTAASTANFFDGRFFCHGNMSDGKLPWLRPGRMFVGVVTEDGNFVVLRKSFGTSSAWDVMCELALPGIGSTVKGADVIGTKGTGVRIAVLQESDPESVSVMSSEGDPTWTARSIGMRVKQSGTLSAIRNCEFRSLAFDPCSGGTKVIATITGGRPDELILVQYAQGRDRHSWPECGMWVKSGLALNPDSKTVDSLRFACSSDGTCVAALSGMEPPILLDISNLSVMENFQTMDCSNNHSPMACQPPQYIQSTAPAFSAGGCAFAVGLHTNDGQARLQIWILKEHSTLDRSSAGANSDKIAWGFVNRHATWDALERLRLGDVMDGAVGKGCQETLRLLDNMVHAHPYHPRPLYAAMLDQVKARVLAYSKDRGAKVVLYDIYSRSMVVFLHNVLNGRYLKGEDANGAEAMTAKEMEHWMSWLKWLQKLKNFLCECLKAWIVRCRSMDANASDTESPSHVPFVRLLLDSYFMQRLTSLVCTLPRLVKTPHGDFGNFYELLKQASTTIRPQPDGPKEDPTLSKTGMDPMSVVEGVKAVLNGNVHLHYYRPDGVLNWKEMSKLESLSSLAAIAPLSDAEIDGRVAELGLCPIVRPPPFDSPLSDLTKGYSQFRKQVGADETQPKGGSRNKSLMLELKRKRWRLDRDVAIGRIPSGLPTQLEFHRVDCLNGGSVALDTSAPCYWSVDGSSITGLLQHSKDQAESGSMVPRACMVASPITGSRWKRIKM